MRISGQVDKLGHVALPVEAAAALFQVDSQRYLKTSIVITINCGVGARGETLGDNTVAALLDRLPHRSVVLVLDCDSYRLRQHHTRNENLRTTTRQPLR